MYHNVVAFDDVLVISWQDGTAVVVHRRCVHLLFLHLHLIVNQCNSSKKHDAAERQGDDDEMDKLSSVAEHNLVADYIDFHLEPSCFHTDAVPNSTDDAPEGDDHPVAAAAADIFDRMDQNPSFLHPPVLILVQFDV